MQEHLENLLSVFTHMQGSNVLVLPDPPLFTVIAVSQSYLADTGISKEALVGKGLLNVFPNNPADPNKTSENTVRASLEFALKYKEIHHLPVQRYDVPDGSGRYIERYWLAVNKPICNDRGEVVYLIHTIEDVTKKVEAERREAQVKSIESFYHLFLQAPVAICIVKGLEYRVELANEEMLQILGRTESMIGKPIIQSLPEARQQGLMDILDYVQRTGKVYHAPYFPASIVINGEREERFYDLVFKPYFEDTGNIVPSGIFCVAHNITQQIQVQKRVEESEEKYRSLFHSMDQGFCIMEIVLDEMNLPVDYRFLEINPVFEELTGLKEACGKTALELVPNLERQWIELYGNVALTGEPNRFMQGSEAMGRWFEGYAFRLGSSGSHKVALLFTDITKRKQNNEALLYSEQRFQNLIREATVGIIVLTGEDMKVEVVNSAYGRLIGRTAEELLQRPLFTIIPEAEEPFRPIIEKVRSTGEPTFLYDHPYYINMAEGLKEGFLNIVYQPYKETDGTITGVMVLCQDVTAQVQYRKEAVEEAERARLAIAAAELGTYNVELKTGKLISSERLNAIFDVDHPGERERYVSAIHPDDMTARSKAYEEAFQTGYLEYEARVIRKDHSIRWIRAKGKIFFEQDQTPQRMIGVVQDITDEKQFASELARMVEERTAELEKSRKELEKYVEELKRSNTNLEQFAYAASHDLKEPTRKIHVFSERLKASIGDRMTASEKHYFERMELASNRMSTLIDDLLMYSEVSQERNLEETIDMNELLVQVLNDLDLQIEQKTATINLGRLFSLKGNKRQWQQAFYNLVGNALKYSKPNVPPVIHISAGLIKGEELAVQLPNADQGKEYHLVEVRDNGIGFNQEDADRIFNVFTRLHGMAEYKGTGVGLAIVRKVIENHGGMIWAESREGQGASFRMALPKNDDLE